ncbi:MAG: hypothetical protein MK101_10895 [Phycisphaerales bacterium]|nr:hypothetical protein [Phycisphaerales bacterium]
MPIAIRLALAALGLALLVLLLVLVATATMSRRARERRRKPLTDRNLPDSRDKIDPWVEAGRRHGDADDPS